ncbi:hypothetical protein N3K66_002369 [Trichothecium roseum]|uniref:Uncharacterized protein n=1 Tax=Trichothecium roseum TaxID=47278 RepID=A0ACC0V9E0_9HYPO|nr:hypothetical protein N3K66_002369 [Trichothecium roseum]
MAASKPDMSPATRAVLAKVQRMIPPMLDKFHKGQLGRVAVIGGSQDYTGAPYFSAIASAKLGCDMSHVICTPGAGAVIKTYSPNLMVHPLMQQQQQQQQQQEQQSAPDVKGGDAEEIASPIIDMLPRLHVLVAGPGLGRDPLMHDTVALVVGAARRRGMPVVLDADALQIVQRDPDLVRGYAAAVLTPNVVEFKRLCDALGLDDDSGAKETDRVEKLARALGGVTVVQKGPSDFISNGAAGATLEDDLPGGRKRSGGQGDTLTGTLATFLAWRKAYLDGLWDDPAGAEDKLGADELVGLAAFGGSAVTREASRLAFAKKGRSLQASDLTDEVHNAFLNLFPDVDGDGRGSKL